MNIWLLYLYVENTNQQNSTKFILGIFQLSLACAERSRDKSEVWIFRALILTRIYVTGNKRMRTITNFFIFNLALTDLINTIFNSIFNFIFMKNK